MFTFLRKPCSTSTEIRVRLRRNTHLAPEIATPVSVRWNLNSYEGSMGAEAFGIVVTLYALCHMAETFGDERLIDHYHALRAFAVQHPEQREIFRAID
ncbi:antirestriction protein [Burkholderia cenocepacia]|nr:antirestriction protein [Burkholderia cenocepacia]